MFTKAQKKVRDTVLSAGEGAYLTAYINPNNTKYFRLLTAEHKPIKNLQCGIIKRMVNSEYFVSTDGRIGKVLTPSESLKDTVAQEQKRKEEKEAKSKTVRG